MALEIAQSLYLSKNISSTYLQPGIRRLFAGTLGQGVMSFADTLIDIAYKEGNTKKYSRLMEDTLSLYDFLLITALGPETVRVADTQRRSTARGGHFTNMRLRFFERNDAELEISLSQEVRRRKIEANLIRSLGVRNGKEIEAQFLGVSAVSWAPMPIETEMVLGTTKDTRRFFPLPVGRMRKSHFDECFDGLMVLHEQLEQF